MSRRVLIDIYTKNKNEILSVNEYRLLGVSLYFIVLVLIEYFCQGITFDTLNLAKATKAILNVKAVWPSH